MVFDILVLVAIVFDIIANVYEYRKVKKFGIDLAAQGARFISLRAFVTTVSARVSSFERGKVEDNGTVLPVGPGDSNGGASVPTSSGGTYTPIR